MRMYVMQQHTYPNVFPNFFVKSPYKKFHAIKALERTSDLVILTFGRGHYANVRDATAYLSERFPKIFLKSVGQIESYTRAKYEF